MGNYFFRILMAYIGLAFLGVFGVHRFYLRRPVSGFVYLFTGGLMGLGVLVDIVLIPAMACEGPCDA
jgi:TM2 domain-containing membrane protein YozV